MQKYSSLAKATHVIRTIFATTTTTTAAATVKAVAAATTAIFDIFLMTSIHNALQVPLLLANIPFIDSRFAENAALSEKSRKRQKKHFSFVELKSSFESPTQRRESHNETHSLPNEEAFVSKEQLYNTSHLVHP